MSGQAQEPAGGQAYDNAVYRMNHPEYEDNDATFDSVLAEELGSAS
jgi:hypothetical protein